MKYYLDITLLPDAEANLGFLWHKVYQQIHIMLVEHKVSEQDSAIGLSFPQYGNKKFPLGDKLRLFAQTQTELEKLKVTNWLNRFKDYVHIKTIKDVPSDITEYVYFKRWQFKSPEKLRRNIDERAQAIASRNGFDVSEVKKRLLTSIDGLDKKSELPFINLRSLSTEKKLSSEEQSKYLIFVECQKTTVKADNPWLFSCYGLSRRNIDAQIAVPWFN